MNAVSKLKTNNRDQNTVICNKFEPNQLRRFYGVSIRHFLWCFNYSTLEAFQSQEIVAFIRRCERDITNEVAFQPSRFNRCIPIAAFLQHSNSNTYNRRIYERFQPRRFWDTYINHGIINHDISTMFRTWCSTVVHAFQMWYFWGVSTAAF